MNIIEKLAETYPQLYLNPDSESRESYREIVLKGGQPESRSLSHFHPDERDCIETIDTPAGETCVITLFDRGNFEIFIRCMTAAKYGPDKPVPPTKGASTLTAFNWPKIYRHKETWLKEQRDSGVLLPDWNAEFRCFTGVKSNYQDTLIVLSCGPYSNVSAADAGTDEENWLKISHDIRLYHECTHFICRRFWPELTDEVRDELVADMTGIYAALGRADAQLAQKFLGISPDGSYTGGRLENYVNTDPGEDSRKQDLDSLAAECLRRLEAFSGIISDNTGEAVFDVMEKMELSGF